MNVYKVTNTVNGKCYIGQTVQKLNDRWIQHCTPKSGCVYLSNAIKLYGKDNFKIEILEECNSIEEMNIKETYYIRLFKTLAPDGYNLMTGGKNSLPSEYTKNKRSASLKKFYKTNARNPVSEETRRKISEAGKGRKRTPNQIIKTIEATSIKVSQYTKSGEFVKEYFSSQEAYRVTGINNSEIGKCCKGRRRLAGGFQWRYHKADSILPVRERKCPPKRGEGNAPNAKKVALVDDNGNILNTYKTAKKAAEENHCDHSGVVSVCNGKLKTTNKLKFIYI